MSVSHHPHNQQHAHWKDTFKVAVQGTTLQVTRTDQGGGWGQNLVLKVSSPTGHPFVYSTFTVVSSSNTTKTMQLPQAGMIVDHFPENPQASGWKDTFKVSVEGRALSVTRTDREQGWGQHLVLRVAANNFLTF